MNTEYTTVAAVAEYLGITIPSGENAKVQSWIRAMSRHIDALCNRSIYRTEEETFTYDGDGTPILLINDVSDLSSVEVEHLGTVEVVGYPQNKGYYSRLALKDGSRWPRGRANVSVSGIFGMCKELPEDIKYATTVLVAGIYNAKDVAARSGKSERIGDYQVQYTENSTQEDDYKSIGNFLAPYKRIAL